MSNCVPHAECGHRVTWTGVVRSGEPVIGTGCWIHSADESDVCERCKSAPVTDADAGLCDGCSDNNAGRVVL